MVGFLLVNFGGPRNLAEVLPFLTTLLTDEDVIWTNWPSFLQRWFFRRIAMTRAKVVARDYEKIGGGSPIFEETEILAKNLTQLLGSKVLTFHRYLPETHAGFLQEIEEIDYEKIVVFPMFPQFSYATTGSTARWMQRYLKPKTLEKLSWIKSYCAHPLFIECQKGLIAGFLTSHALPPEKTLLLFSMHGLPQCFVCLGDPYEKECHLSCQALAKEFVGYKTKMAFQSKFGPGRWLQPSTEEVCHQVEEENIVFIPLGFTSDHIETLVEIEEQYLPIVRKRGLKAYRCPALGFHREWIEAMAKIMNEAREDPHLFENQSLIRTIQKRGLCKNRCRLGLLKS